MGEAGDEVEILEIAFQESARKLGVIEEAAESIRSRAGTLLATATAAGSFVGALGVAASPEGSEWWAAVVGVIAYLAAVGSLVFVGMPKVGGWKAGQNITSLARVAGKESRRDVLFHLSISYQGYFDDHERQVQKLARWFRIGVAATVVEVLSFACLLLIANTSESAPPSTTQPRPPSTTQPRPPSTTQPPGP